MSVKDPGPERPCPICGRMFAETMPLGTGDRVVWKPRPVCTHHNVNTKTGEVLPGEKEKWEEWKRCEPLR